MWDVEDGTELPKEITVKVLNNGADFETLTLNAENGWQATLIDLPGDRTYTVEEVAVDGYVANYSDMVQSGDFDGESNREWDPGRSICHDGEGGRVFSGARRSRDDLWRQSAGMRGRGQDG